MRRSFFGITLKLTTAILLSTTTALAGNLIWSTLYVPQTVVQGHGTTYEKALKDARSAIPRNCNDDPNNSLVFECTESIAFPAKDGTLVCDLTVHKNVYRVTIPLLCR